MDGLGDKNVTTRFSGAEQIADPLFSTAAPKILKRLWALSSVRYLLAAREHFLPPAPSLIKQLLAGYPTADPDYLRLTVFNIAGADKYVLFQHPYGPDKPNIVELKTVVPSDRSWLRFSIGMDPSIYGIANGDGVDFKVVVVDHDKQHEVFSKYIDPKASVADRRWFMNSIDLSEYNGRAVTMRLVVDSGPNGNAASDWAGWADLQFIADAHSLQLSTPQPPDRPAVIYDKEVKIYDLKDTLARASLFYGAQYVDRPEQALTALRSDGFDIYSKVILEKSDSAPQVSATSAKVVAQKINQYEPLLVDISVNAQRAGILMLNDEFFPGWNAYLDDRRVPIYHADYLFRGVSVPKGSHRLVFKYEPMSFVIGIGCFLVAVSVLMLYTLLPLARFGPKSEDDSHSN